MKTMKKSYYLKSSKACSKCECKTYTKGTQFSQRLLPKYNLEVNWQILQSDVMPVHVRHFIIKERSFNNFLN